MKKIAAIITVIACGLMYYFSQSTQVPHTTSEWLDASQMPVTSTCEKDTTPAKVSTSCNTANSHLAD
jgi:hypothetical protein